MNDLLYWLAQNRDALIIEVVGGLVTAGCLALLGNWWFAIKVRLYLKHDGERIWVILENKSKRVLRDVKLALSGFDGYSYVGSRNNQPFIAYPQTPVEIMSYTDDQWRQFWDQGHLKEFETLEWILASQEGTKKGEIKRSMFLM